MHNRISATTPRASARRSGVHAYDLYSTIEHMPVLASGKRERSILSFMIDATWISDDSSDRLLFNADEIASSALRLAEHVTRPRDHATLTDLAARMATGRASN